MHSALHVGRLDDQSLRQDKGNSFQYGSSTSGMTAGGFNALNSNTSSSGINQQSNHNFIGQMNQPELCWKCV